MCIDSIISKCSQTNHGRSIRSSCYHHWRKQRPRICNRSAAITLYHCRLSLTQITARRIALQYRHIAQANQPLTLYLTARNPDLGSNAYKQLRSEYTVDDAEAPLDRRGLVQIRFQRLDVTSVDSIHRFSSYIHEQHAGSVQILVNNAGIAPKTTGVADAEDTINCNYYGTLRMMENIAPNMLPAGRIVNMASMIGKLNKYSPEIVSRFTGATTIEQVTALMEEFLQSLRNNTLQQDGWPTTAYGVSKAGVIAITGIFARLVRENGSKVLVNSCCPGYVKTDMTGRGRLTPDGGAKTPVMLALNHHKPDETGLFWERCAISSWLK